MTSSWFQITRRYLCIGFLVLLCFLSYLVSYLDINLTSFSLCRVSSPGPEDRVSPPGPEDMVNTSLQVLHPNCTSDRQISPQSVHTEEDVLILMWFWPFGDKVNIRCSELDMEGCRLTDDRSVYHKAHAVLFHHRDIHGGLDNMPPEPRPWFQKWIWFNWESPTNSNNIPALNDLFNLTSSYRLDSHIPVPYGYLTPVTQEDESFKLPEKDKLVCWVVSNWNPQFKRVKVYEEMKNHVKIEVYGRAFNRAVTPEEYVKVMHGCKFYLSWENSIDRDYTSDKLYDPLRMGAVPVVLGPSRTNYEDHVPGDSFIHVDDFAGGPKELAERLLYLDGNHTEYMQYFKWRESLCATARVSVSPREHSPLGLSTPGCVGATAPRRMCPQALTVRAITMTSSWFQVTRRHLCIGFLVLLCFLLYLISYLDINLTSFRLCRVSSPGPEDRVSPPGPEDIVNTSLQVLHPNCTSDRQISPQSTEAILILMWFWPFGGKVNIRCSELDMEGCRLTDDRSVYHEAHAVLFHHGEIHGGLDNLPPEPRPWFQKWIWFNWESPTLSSNIPALNDVFNLTSSYRLDSHIPVPYGYLTPVTQEDKSFKLPEKDKLVCWIVSNWNPQFKRVKVYEEMKKHVKIEVYGKAFNRPVNYEEYDKVMHGCKFYLSWENSIHRDYMTEKLYIPLMMGAVPVVLGPSRANYEDHIPGDSFIHVNDFAGGPKELAERLLYLDGNHTEYMQYFKWRERYKVHRFSFVSDQVCRSCQHLKMKKHKGYQRFHGLSKWYWG